jgi:hypothetical protein
VATGLSSPIASLLRLVSRIACLIVIASFAIFVVHQATDASNHQQNELNSTLPPGSTAATLPTNSNTTKKSTPHRVIDEVAEEITSPFHAITSGTSNQWAIQGVNLVMALLVWGFGLSFLARVLRA